MKSIFYKFSLTVTLLIALSAANLFAQYCTTNLYSYGCQYGDYIDNCIVGSINQTATGCTSGSLGFSDYTSLSTELEQGSTYSLTVSVGYYGMYVSMWIDMDDDSLFEASEKLVSYLYCSTPFVNYSANFVMPVFAIPGDHRMRIRSVSYTFPVDPCLSYSYGEVHDYMAHVVSPANMSYLSSTTTQANTSTTSSGSLDVEVLGLQVMTSGSLNPLTLTSITVNSNGTTDFNSDVDNVKIYYTGTDPFFSTTTLFGSSSNLSSPITGNVTLAPGINYFWVVYDLSPTATLGNYIDAEVTQIHIDGVGDETPSITAPAGNRQLNYCTAENTNGCYFAYIDGITLNTLSNLVTYCNGSTDGYIYYGPVGSLTTSLQLGTTYTITLNGPPYEPVGFGVWIDFNDDGDFSDVSEFVFSTSTYAAGSVSGTITIPSSAPLGEHRMRVRAKDYGVVSSSESCTTFQYGETEDYVITLVNSTQMNYVSSTTTQNNTGSVEAGQTNVEIIGLQIVTDGSLSPFDLTSITVNSNGTTDFSNDVTNVEVYYTGNDPNFSTTNLFGSSSNLSSPITGNQQLNAGTNYFWITYDLSSDATIGNYLDAEVTQIQLSNGGGTHVPTVTAPAGNRQVNYCLPTTTYGCTNGYIDGVIFNTLSNTLTGCNGSPDGYINYAPTGNLTTSVELGGTYNITLSGPIYGFVSFGVWIDFNDDGDFDDADEFVFTSPFAATGTQYGTITIPTNASYVGEHRMRIRSKEYSVITSGEACSEFLYSSGETEDYTITITPTGPMSFLSATTTQNVVSPVSLGQSDVEILSLQISTSGSLSPFAVTSITVSSNGSTDFFGDVSNVDVYYTGTNPVFDTATAILFGSSTTLASPITGNQVLASGTNYFWVTYDLSTTGSLGDFLDAEITEIEMTGTGGTQVPIVTAPAGYRVIDYCIPNAIYGCYFAYIDGITLNTLSNTATNCNGNTNGYIQYAPDQGTTTSMALGESYDLQLDGPFYGLVGFGVWIDYNNDGDFDDLDEFVYSSPYTASGSQFATITIASDPSYVGDHRMRVRAKDYALITASESCTDFFYGETEDYTITLTPAVTEMTYVSSTTTQNNLATLNLGEQNAEILGIQIVTNGALNPFAVTSFTLLSTGSSNFGADVTNVEIYYSGTSPTFSTAILFGSATDLSAPITGSQTLSAGTNYFWVTYDISPTATLGNYLDAGCTEIVMTGAGGTQTPSVTEPFGSRQINLCVPTYTSPCSSGDYIDIFTFNTLSNLYSGCNGNINNYIYYDPGTYTTEVQAGATYTITLQSGATYGQGFGVWIDYNNNADFGDPGEFVYASPSSGTQLFTGTITIAVDPSFYGDRRMRVRCAYSTVFTAADWCNSSFYYGETEDYTITITPPPACTGTPVAGTVSATPEVVCSSGSTVTLTASGFSAAADLVFQWQQSPNGSSWTDISGATSSTLSTTINSSTYYRVKVTCINSGQTATSSSTVVNVGGNEEITSTSGATICGQGNVSLEASANSEYVLWYTSESGGSPVYYSSSPSTFTPYVNTTTTYYAAAATGTINIGSVGPEDNSMGTVSSLYTYSFEYFSVYQNCILQGVYVYPASAGNVVIQLTDKNYNVLQTATVAVTSAQINQKTYIPLDFTLTPGVDYHLTWAYPSVNLYSNDYGATYPYELPGVISITGSSYGGSYYFYFYDWQINYSNLCESDRTPVEVTVTPAPAVTISANPSSAAICTGSGESVTLTASGPYTSYLWTPADGLNNSTGSTVSATPDSTTTYIVTASNNTCTNADTITVSVVDAPSLTATANPEDICAGGATQLLASAPALTYSVSEITFSPDASQTGTQVTLADDGLSSALPVGFNFNFYGNDYTEFYISANGFMTFNPLSGAGCCAGQFLPDMNLPSDLIAFAWEDLSPNLGGIISYYTTGTAPSRKLVMNFDAVPHYYYGSAVDPVTSQVILYESTNNIEIHTTSMPGNPSGFWAPHTMGIENADGTLATTVPGRNADATWTATNDAWRFSPPQYTYNWTPANSLSDANIMNPIADPNSTTTYTVTVTDVASLCSSTGTATVSIITTPEAGTITASVDEFCMNGQATLTLEGYSPGASIQWKESATSGGPYTNIPSATDSTYTTPLLTTTTYYVVKVTCANSTTTSEAAVTVNNPPAEPLVIDSGHCGPGTVTLGAVGSGTGSLDWYYSQFGDTYLGSGSTFTTPFISSTTTFWVEQGQADPDPLTTSYTGTYSQNAAMFDITALNEVFITGFDVNLGSGTSDFEIYYKPGTFAGSETNGSAWTFAGTVSGVVSAGFGVPTPVPINIAIHIPEGETYAFYIASSNYNYIYYDIGTAVGNVAASDGNIEIKEGAVSYYPFGFPTTPAIWNGTVHYKAPGCASIRVPVEASIFSPQAVASASDNIICEGETIELTASNITAGTFTYAWSPAIPGMLPQDGIGQTVTVSPPVTMTFTVTVSNDAEGCDTAVAVNVTVNPSPAVYISGLESQYYDIDPVVTLTGNPSGGAFAGPGVSGNTFDPGAVGIGTYTITYTYTDANGCTGSTSEQVNVVPFVGIAGISDSYDLSIYPNPTEGLFTLDLKLPDPASEVIMRVYNMVGQPVFETVFGAAKDELKQTFDFSEWAAGSYFVQVALDGKTAYRKLTIQK